MIQEKNLHQKIDKTEKDLLREKISNDTKEFLKSKSIKNIPTGVSGEAFAALTPKQRYLFGMSEEEKKKFEKKKD